MRLRAIVALAASAVAMLFAAGPAHAAAALYPPTVCATLSVSTTHPLVGEQITVSGIDFEPNHSVHLVLSPSHDLATVTSDGQGSFTTSVKLPDGVTGTHRITATSGAPHNASCPSAPFAIIEIQTPGGTTAGTGGHHGGTSFTGVDVLLIVLAAVVLIGAGLALNRSGKRRPAHSGHPMID